MALNSPAGIYRVQIQSDHVILLTRTLPVPARSSSTARKSVLPERCLATRKRDWLALRQEPSRKRSGRSGACGEPLKPHHTRAGARSFTAISIKACPTTEKCSPDTRAKFRPVVRGQGITPLTRCLVMILRSRTLSAAVILLTSVAALLRPRADHSCDQQLSRQPF
jgi:hypothetical protein